MLENSREPFHRRHKLALQSLALGMMMLVPIALYFAARAGLDAVVLAFLVALGAGMLLAVWVG
jgi:hypothetical protein